jgi:hypothetical protein
MNDGQEFDLVFPYERDDGTWNDWIGVLSGSPMTVPYPFEVRLRYSEKGELLCAGLRIGEGSNVGSGREPNPPWTGDPRHEPLIPQQFGAEKQKCNVTRRMLCALPLGAVLRFIQDEVFADPDPMTRSFLDWLWSGVELVMPPEGRWVRPGPKGNANEVYIKAAELFKAHCVKGSNAAVYRSLTKQRHLDESTFRRHVKRGWELRPELKPEGIRTRRTTKKEGKS